MVEVFKTNVRKTRESKQLVRRLLEQFPESRINFDLEDCDKILRIEAPHVEVEKTIGFMKEEGFECVVLE